MTLAELGGLLMRNLGPLESIVISCDVRGVLDKLVMSLAGRTALGDVTELTLEAEDKSEGVVMELTRRRCSILINQSNFFLKWVLEASS
jgi:hypothetical protein